MGLKNKIKENSLRNYLINIILLIGTVIFTFFAIVIILKVLLPSLQYSYPQGYFKKDNLSGFDIKENSPPKIHAFADDKYIVWSNELGCFDEPYHGEKDYILLTGDSFSWGYVPLDDTFGSMIQKYLGLRVLKCAVSGYGTKQEFIKIKKTVEAIENKPSLIIVGYAVNNDFLDDYLFPVYAIIDGYRVTKVKLRNIKTGEKEVVPDDILSRKYIIFQTIINAKEKIRSIINQHFTKKQFLHRNLFKSKLYEIMKGDKLIRTLAKKIGLLDTPIFTPQFLTKNYSWVQLAWDDHLHNLMDIKALADGYNAKLLVVLIPIKEQVYDFLKPAVDSPDCKWDLPNNLLGNFLNEKKINSFDLTPHFRGYANQNQRRVLDSENDLYWQIDGHWNIKGNRLAGLLITDYILEHGLIYINDASNKKAIIKREIDTLKY